MMVHKDCGGKVISISGRYYCLECNDEAYEFEVEEVGADVQSGYD